MTKGTQRWLLAGTLVAWGIFGGARSATADFDGIVLDPPTAENEVGTDHTVTATVTYSTQPGTGFTVSFEVLTGPNAGESSDPGECGPPGCVTNQDGQVSWTYSGNGGLGTDVIQACFNTPAETQLCDQAEKEWVDRTPPSVACVETTNPHGMNVPRAGQTSNGQNEDGFYELGADDAVDPDPMIFVVDEGSGTEFGPFASGTKIKYTQAPGATPSQRDMGSESGKASASDWHITGNGDASVYAVDDSGGVSATMSCLVPPPPK